jgi:twitching motility protein PilT
VIATLHTLNATTTIERLINVFPGEQQNQIRSQLAESLLLILSQRLIPSFDGQARRLAYEKLTTSGRVKNLIRNKKLHQIRTQTASDQSDFEPIDLNLARLVTRGKVRYEDALKYAENPSLFSEMAKRKK